jgi:hypothetical protein
LHTNNRFDAEQIHVEANTASKQIFASHVLILAKYLLQNIRFETNNHKTLSKFHIQANICLQIYAYKGIFTCKYSQFITLITFILLQNIRFEAKKIVCSCAADFSLLNLPKGKSLGRSKSATNS